MNLKKGDIVTLVNADCDYYEARGNAIEKGLLAIGQEYEIVQLEPNPHTDSRYNLGIKVPLIQLRINHRSEKYWWVKASAFIKKEDHLNLPEWF